MKKMTIYISLFTVIIISLTTCSDNKHVAGKDIHHTSISEPDGAVLTAYRGYLYLTGGIDTDGKFSDRVLFAALNSDGSTGEWQTGTPLPSARAWHSCIAYGDEMYLLGGKDDTGNLNDVWFAYINSDGQIGFKNYGVYKWEHNSRDLPVKISGGSAAASDGVLFILGGEIDSAITNDVMYAKIWRDGQLGMWYRTNNRFETERKYASSAASSDRLYISGGINSTGYLNDLQYTDIEYGKIGLWNRGADLPASKAFHNITVSSIGIIVSGGFNATENSWNNVYHYTTGTGSWAETSDGISPVTTISNGYMYGITEDENGNPSVITATTGIQAADAPHIFPGSKAVSSGTKLRVFGNPGDTIRYTTGATPDIPDPVSDSTIYDNLSPLKITADTYIKIRSFRDGYEPSLVIKARYFCKSGGMFVFLQSTLSPVTGDPVTATYFLKDTLSNGTTNDVTAVWFKLNIPAAGSYSLKLYDSTSNSGAGYTAATQLSLFEGDFYTSISDSDGKDFYKLDSIGTNASTAMNLSAGNYYLRIESSNGTAGGSFGLSFRRI